jgi:DNA-binding transcriptional MerR regulator
MKDSFTVGELAALFHLNVQTLHYYESIGLFRPLRRREGSGMRIYQFDQIYALATIRFLKKLEYPLARIQATMDSRDTEVSLRSMREQSEELRERCESLERIRQAIDRKIRFIEERSSSLDPTAIRRLEFPERHYILIGPEEDLYHNDDFYFYPTIVFYTLEGKRFGAMLTGTPEPARQEAPTGAQSDQELVPGGATEASGGLPRSPLPRTISAGAYLVGYHQGPYDRIAESFARIRSEAATRGLWLEDESLNINIIDQFVERNPARYITEIQMRILS